MFYVLCITYLSLDYLLINHRSWFMRHDGEDGIIELLGALFLLFTSAMLIAAALAAKNNATEPRYKMWTFAAMGVLFFWAAGEEISWGQHMFGHVTPEWLAKINGQQETNLHNINKKFFDRWQERAVALVAMFTAFSHFQGRQSLWGFRLPCAPLALAFLLLPIFRRLDEIHLEVWHAGFVFFGFYVASSLMSTHKKMLKMCGLFVITAVTVYYVHSRYTYLFRKNNNIYHEVRETMFSLFCLTYAVQLWVSVHKVSEKPSVMGWIGAKEKDVISDAC